MNVRKLLTAAMCFGVAVLSIVSVAQPWIRQSALPTDRSPKGVFAMGPNRAFVVGSDQLILETTTQGATWNVRKVGDWWGEPFYAVHFVNSTVGLTSGNTGMLRSTNGGTTWLPIDGFPAGSWSYLDSVGTTVFAGANGACAASTDAGATWTVRSGWPTCPVMFGMDFVDDNVGLCGGLIAGTSEVGIFKTTDGGRTWTKRADGSANDVLWMSATRALADQGTTMRESLDAGDTWHPIAFGITSGFDSLTRAGASNVVLGVSGKGDVWRSGDGGYSWIQTFDGPGALPEPWEISFADELHGWIVGPGGFLYYSADGGLTWQQKNSGCNSQITDIQMLNMDYGLAVGRNGYMFRTTNGGAFWEIQKLEVTGQIWGRDEDLVALDIVDANFAATAGPGGTAFKTQDGGRTWTSIGYPSLPGTFMIYDVDFVDANLGYLYGVDDSPPHTHTLYRTRNGGATWEWVDLGDRGGGTTVQFADALHGWLTADNTFGLKTADGGATWTPFLMPEYYTGPEVSMVRFRGLSEGWAVGWNGYVAKSTDGGQSWRLLDLGTIDDHLFDVVPVTASEIWLCGREDFTNIGILYHSLDGGSTWTRQVVTDWFYYPYRMSALTTGDAWFAGYVGSIFRRPTTPVVVDPVSLLIVRGFGLGGSLGSLLLSDDRYLIVVPHATSVPGDDPIMVQVEGIAPTANASALQFLMESRVSAGGIEEKVQLWNYAQARWEVVHLAPAPLTDTLVTVSAPAPASRFIDPATRKVRAQMRWRPTGIMTRTWRALIDRSVWRLTP